jgi:hypothetical protein
MGGPDVFELKVEGSGVYFSGQTISGQVILASGEELTNIKSVTIKIKGKGEVDWTEQVC